MEEIIFLGKCSHQKELLGEYYYTPFCTPIEGNSEFIFYLHSNLLSAQILLPLLEDLKASLLLPLPLKKFTSHCFRFHFLLK